MGIALFGRREHAVRSPMTAAGETSTAAEAGYNPKSSRSHALTLTILGLLAVCALFAIAVAAIHPTEFFGLSEDDSIYLSSARALANGHGYLLESVPGSPPATKYPVLFSWLLSWTWRWHSAVCIRSYSFTRLTYCLTFPLQRLC